MRNFWSISKNSDVDQIAFFRVPLLKIELVNYQLILTILLYVVS